MIRRRFLVPLLGLSATAFAYPLAPDNGGIQKVLVDYNRDIRPILAANCFACHGLDEVARKGNLRLDSPNRAVVGGDVLASALFQRIQRPASDPLAMPPASSGHTLKPEQKALLVRWLDQGGKYQQHWSFVAPARPHGDSAVAPNNGGKTLSGSPLLGRGGSIDTLIRAKLKESGLTPAPKADRHTLIRRVSLDLTGLPPTPEEVRAFVTDTKPGAYERVVDRLLASPRYGEHWARMWLDLARYADTKGYEKDLTRTIWRWRDGVIDSLNADMPFDQFTIEQLAGDLLPNATESQILATAFHRNTMTNDEGGTDDEEFRQVAVKDRVDTTVQVWMGLTMGCAKCHAHKYDPITQKDYYRFYAIFNQTEDNDRYDDSPTMPLGTAAQYARRTELDKRLAELRAEAAKPSAERTAWEKALEGTTLWSPLRATQATAESGATLTVRPDGSVLASGVHKTTDRYTLTLPLPTGKLTALRLEVLKDPSLPNGGPGRDKNDQNAVISELTVTVEGTPVRLTRPRADFEQGGWPVANAIDGREDTGWAWSPQNAQPHVALFDIATPKEHTGGTLTVSFSQNYPNLSVGCFRLSVSTADPALLTATLSPLASPQSRDEAFLKQTNPVAFAELERLEKERGTLEKSIPRTPILRELPKDRQRTTRVHQRGNFLDPGEVVTPALLPQFLPPSLADLPLAPSGKRRGDMLTRLDAARWLVSKSNPLTPRVMANRVWARFFGVGIVETEEDFGTQGAAPSHPELLDWLAVHFRDDCHWSLKKLCKTLVLSETYQQSAKATLAAQKRDPRNRLLSHAPRFRLSAETVRDQALAAAGLLSPKRGGPSVFPPQPAGLWKVTYSGMKWETSPGEDRWRRGIYTFLRRTSPHPMLTTFDGTSGEVCTLRRIRTNTPLQALITLNDPAFVEAAGALGRAMAKQGLDAGFVRVLARSATPAERTRLNRLFQETLAEYRQKPTDALALLKDANQAATPNDDAPLLAAWTVVGNVLLNLDETLTKP